MEKVQDKQKCYYDKHHKLTTFKAGNFVLLSTRNYQLPGLKKLSPCFVRLCEILA